MLHIIQSDKQKILSHINRLTKEGNNLLRDVDNGSILSYSEVVTELRHAVSSIELVIEIIESLANEAFNHLAD